MMKFGIRRPRPLGSLRARATARVKRRIKRAIFPGYGSPGKGWARDPRRTAYHAVHRRATAGAGELLRKLLR